MSIATPTNIAQSLPFTLGPQASGKQRTLEESEPANPSESLRFDLTSLDDPRDAKLLTRVAAEVSRMSGGDAAIAIVDSRGRIRHLVKSESGNAERGDTDTNCVQAGIREAWMARRPLLIGFPMPELNSASWVLNDVARKLHCTSILAFPIAFQSGLGGGVVLVRWRQSDEIRFDAVNLLLDHAPVLEPRLELWYLCDMAMRWLGRARSIQNLFAWRRKTVLWCTAIAFASLCLPISYQPKRDAILQPAARSFVTSPIDGILKETYVRPGDRVTRGQLLARWDDRIIRSELAVARAELEAAQKRYDRALYQRAGGDLSIAQLEHEQIAIKIKILEDKLDRLEARSPIDGTVVQGDWFGSEGMSLTLGQSLFEIAPLDSMTVEVHLLPTDLAWATEGLKAKLHSEATPGRSWSGTISRIEPAAERIEQQVYFVGEMKVENRDAILRPGMKGLVRVQAGYRTLGWLLFRGPYRWLQHQWIW